MSNVQVTGTLKMSDPKGLKDSGQIAQEELRSRLPRKKNKNQKINQINGEKEKEEKQEKQGEKGSEKRAKEININA